MKKVDINKSQIGFIAIVLALLVIIGVVLSFFVGKINSQAVISQNQSYTQNIARMTAGQIENSFIQAKKQIKSISSTIAFILETDEDISIEALLKEINKESLFERIVFITPDGINHSIEGNADVSDREYFRKGMMGITGMEWMRESRITGKSSIMFYSPVYVNDEIAGVVAGHYEQKHVGEIIENKLFGIYIDTFLVDNKGRVIAGNYNGKNVQEKKFISILDVTAWAGCAGTEVEHKLNHVIYNKESCEYSAVLEDNGIEIYSIETFGDANWIIFQRYPAGITERMTESLNKMGGLVGLVLIIFFVFVVIALFFIYQRERKGLQSRIDLATADLQTMLHDINKERLKEVELAKQLESAVEEATMANKAKDIFLANTSHEIRTPMNAIVGMTEVLLREEEDEKKRAYLSNIKDSGKNLLEIINDILDISKIESNKLEIIPDVYETAKVIKGIGFIFSERIGDKKIELKRVIDPALPEYLYGDVTRVRQVVINLVNNAIKFTEEGYIKVVAKVLSNDGKEIKILISVEDTGIGIKDEDKERLFEAFTRVDKKKTAQVEGTGLGLTITKELVRQMGGEITVESTYGVGTKFSATIVQGIVDNESIEQKQKEQAQEELEAKMFRAKGARILVAEDNKMNTVVLKALLKPMEADLFFAENGQVAVDMAKKEHYDIILMDHMMPVMDGIEATKEIRRFDSDMKNVPIIALSANAVVGAKVEFTEAGMNDFVSKPIQINRLLTVLRKYLPANLISE